MCKSYSSVNSLLGVVSECLDEVRDISWGGTLDELQVLLPVGLVVVSELLDGVVKQEIDVFLLSDLFGSVVTSGQGLSNLVLNLSELFQGKLFEGQK